MKTGLDSLLYSGDVGINTFNMLNTEHEQNTTKVRPLIPFVISSQIGATLSKFPQATSRQRWKLLDYWEGSRPGRSGRRLKKLAIQKGTWRH